MNLQSFIDSLSDFAIYEVNRQGHIQTWSKGAEHLLGYSAKEIIGQPIQKFIPEQSADSNLTASLEKTAGAGRCENNGWVQRKDGSRFWANEITTLLRNDAGLPIGFAKVLRDFTTWKNAIDERDRIFNNSVDMICIADSNQHFKRVNPSFTRVLGHSEAELIGKPFTDFVHPDDLQATLNADKLINQGKIAPEKPFQNRYRCADGSYRWLEWKAILSTDDGLVYAIARDVTEQKDHEEKLRLISADLERSNADLSQFAYVASHDLQEPLRAVVGCVQMLAERNPGTWDDRSKELMSYIVDGATRMQTLIKDLLLYSRVGSKGINKQLLDPVSVVEDAMRQLQTLIKEKKAVIEFDPMPTVWADEIPLTQVFQNLIGNALKFNGKNTPIVHISAREQGGEVLFTVEDNGIGIAPEYHEKIFGLFQRLHTRRDYPGNGIGLAVCKKIIERHGGKIWMESKSGNGTTFFFTLPKGHHADL